MQASRLLGAVSHALQPAPFEPRLLHLRRRRRNVAVIRAQCSSAYLGGGTALCRVLGRYKMVVDTADAGLSPHLMLDGYWEMWVTEAMCRHLRPGMAAVDVGANLGYFTLLMADLVGASGRVHAVEPNPPVAALLRRNVALNTFSGHASVHEAAACDRDGQDAALAVPAGEPKNAHLSLGAPADCTMHRVRTCRLDTLLAQERVDFIKIDAEGMEEAIWQGMQGILDRGAPLTVFLEFRAARCRDAAAFVRETARQGFQPGPHR